MSSGHAQQQPPQQSYTALQQDRQARNRPANVHGATTKTTMRGGGIGVGAGAPGPTRSAGVRAERERRYNAARILESNEMLSWHSVARNEVSACVH